MCDDGVDGWWGCRREFDPPRPVWLSVRQVFPRSRYGSVQLRIRAAGLDIARVLPAELLAWQQTNYGDWFAEIQTTLINHNKRGLHDARLFAPAEGVCPRRAGEQPPYGW